MTEMLHVTTVDPEAEWRNGFLGVITNLWAIAGGTLIHSHLRDRSPTGRSPDCQSTLRRAPVGESAEDNWKTIVTNFKDTYCDGCVDRDPKCK
jgi:hypothetical protein